MKRYDLFNGDADGICALQQLRLNTPLQTELVTGIKRDINLLDQIQAAEGDQIVALDISFDKNREGVQKALDAGASVFYSDHHYAGEIIESDKLEVHIDTDANICTSLIINRYLEDRFYPWAITGAYGDNLFDSAETLADRFSVPPEERSLMKELGICLNYNGYGFSVEDLIYHPADLFREVNAFENPLEFIETAAYARLKTAYDEDMASTQSLEPYKLESNGAIFILPDEPWARRVNGVFSNDLAVNNPDRAHAVLVQMPEGFRVSVRAPLSNKTGADDLCRQFATGGGRKAAAGINCLPETDLEHFAEAFFKAF